MASCDPLLKNVRNVDSLVCGREIMSARDLARTTRFNRVASMRLLEFERLLDAHRDEVLREAVAKLRAWGYAEAAHLINPDKQS